MSDLALAIDPGLCVLQSRANWSKNDKFLREQPRLRLARNIPLSPHSPRIGILYSMGIQREIRLVRGGVSEIGKSAIEIFLKAESSRGKRKARELQEMFSAPTKFQSATTFGRLGLMLI